MDFFKHRLYEFIRDFHGLGGVEGSGMYFPGRVERRRLAHKGRVLRHALAPGLDAGLECVAVRAAEPEKFHHLDLVRGAGILGRVDDFEAGRGGNAGCGQHAGGCKRGRRCNHAFQYLSSIVHSVFLSENRCINESHKPVTAFSFRSFQRLPRTTRVATL